MFHRLLQLRTALDIVSCHDGMPENLNLEEWNFLESLTKILTPMR